MIIYILVAILIIFIYIRGIREKFAIGDLPSSTTTTTIVNPGAITLSYAADTQTLKTPDQICLGKDRCISSDMIVQMKHPEPCNFFLWDPLNNYREYQSIWNLAGSDKGNWKKNAFDTFWSGGFLAAKYAYCSHQNDYAQDSTWQKIFTEPKLSQTVAGIKFLGRGDNDNSWEQVKNFIIYYMPLTGTTELIVPNPNDSTNIWKGSFAGFDVFFPNVIECKYIKISVLTYSSSPSYRCGLYLCL